MNDKPQTGSDDQTPTPMAGTVIHPEGAAPEPAPSAPHSDPTPSPSRPKRRRRLRWPVVGVMLLVLALLGGGGVFAYQYFRAPSQALAGYLDKLVHTTTGSYSATVDYKPADKKPSSDTFTIDLGEIKLQLAGAYDIKDQKNPKTSVTVNGTMGSYGAQLEARLLDKAAYFKLDKLEGLGGLSLPLGQDWYKADVTDQTSTLDKCQDASTKTSHGFLGSQVMTKFPLKDTKLVALSETVAGHRTTHYRGALDVDRLQAFIDQTNQGLPADCKLTYNASDFKNVTVTYDLWASGGFDRLHVLETNTVDHSRTDATFDTSGYNKPVTITAPSGAKSLEDAFGGLFGGGSVDTSSSAGTGTASQKARDTQRKTDLRSIQKGLEEFFVDNNYYPASLSQLTIGSSPIMKTVPTDPKTHAAYTYVPGPAKCKTTCTSYTLSAKLESPGATGTDISNGVLTLVNNN